MRGKARVKKLTLKARVLRTKAKVPSRRRFPKGSVKDDGGLEVRMALFFFYLVCREVGRVEHDTLKIGVGDCYAPSVELASQL